MKKLLKTKNKLYKTMNKIFTIFNKSLINKIFSYKN